MKKMFIFLVFLIPSMAQATSIDDLLADGYEIKAAATVSAGGMYFILQKGSVAYFCPALDPSKVMECRNVKGQ